MQGALRAVWGHLGAAGDEEGEGRPAPTTTLPPAQWPSTEAEAEGPVPPAPDPEGLGLFSERLLLASHLACAAFSCRPPRAFPVGTDLTLQGFPCPPPTPHPCSRVPRSSPHTPGSGQSHTGAPGVLGVRLELSSDFGV